MSIQGCNFVGGSFSSAFSNAFATGGLVCGPYFVQRLETASNAILDAFTPGIQAAEIISESQEVQINE